MAYLKPPAFVRSVFNPLAMKFGIGGAVTLEVPGRTSGKLQRVPVVPFELQGKTYVGSARGETQWVKNVRVAGGLTLIEKGAATRYSAREIPAAEAVPFHAEFQRVGGKAVQGLYKSLPDLGDHPIFELTRR